MSLDSQSWIEHGKVIRLTQDKWIEKYNQAGKILAAFPDIYHAAKEGNDELITSLQGDFGSWIVTSTRLQFYIDPIFNQYGLEGKIIHYHGSTVVEPRKSKKLVIPVFPGTLIETAILTGANAEQGLVYFQTLCDTQDSAEEIIKNLEKLSGKNKRKIKIWTPPLWSTQYYTRSECPERAALAGFIDDDSFFIGDGNLGSDGRSREVYVSTAGARGGKRVSGSNGELPYNIQSGISRKTHSVHFSSVQEIGDFEKYTGMFCFKDGRYLVSLIRKEGKKISDKRVAIVLAEQTGIDEKIKELNKFNPIYAHIVKYSGDKLVDDVELFGGLEK